MKIYKKVLVALDQTGTPSSMQNKFAKLKHECQDSTLQHLIGDVVFMYSKHISAKYARSVSPENIGRIPRHAREWFELQTIANKRLRDYVEYCIAKQKPEWQVMAESQGWTPPPDWRG